MVVGEDSSQEESSRKLDAVRDLIEKLWKALNGDRERSVEMSESIISKTSEVLFDAVKCKNYLVYRAVLQSNPELLMVLDSEKRSLLHIAVLYRQARPLFHLIEDANWKDLVMQVVDKDGNNILHMAGMVSPDKRFGLSRPEMQMPKDLLWFVVRPTLYLFIYFSFYSSSN